MNENNKTKELLINHYQTYPKIQIQDVFKFLYQSSFGCEHLVSSLDKAIDYISKEYETVQHDEKIKIDRLDGNYSRVYLSYLNEGLSADTLGKLFTQSAKKEEQGLEKLLEKIEVAKELVLEGMLPFKQVEFDKALEVWKANGYKAIHHSSEFRETYKPAYRVISNDFIPFLDLFKELDKRLKKGKLVVAIEGGSASGKTTLGSMLSNIYDSTLFHMDDFFLRLEQRTKERLLEIGGNIDRERFLEEVLIPLDNGDKIEYQIFDCSCMKLGEKINVEPKQLTIIEGAYSMHPMLEKYYDFSIYLNITPELQKTRILKRNSPNFAKRFFEEWIPLENKYFSETNIEKRCNVVINII